ncbi:MAG TPA: AMP-binding protein [Solirubrobacterales bacterium]|nr:AMP-binding protein [Solirubrobacterales bacterium]
MLVYETLRHSAGLRPDHPAVLGGGRTLTYDQLHDRVIRLANVLREDFGIKPEGRVALLSRNRPEMVEVFFAAALGGWTCVPINYRLAPAEVAEIVADAEPSLFIAEPELGDLVEAVRQGGFDRPLVWLGDEEAAPAAGQAYEQLLGRGSPLAPDAVVPYDATLLQMYTSGTTGRPKGVMLTQANLMANSWTHQAERSVVPDDRYLTTAPLCHLAAASRMLLLVHAGATHIIEAGFDAERVVAAVAAGRANSTLVVPAMMRDLLDAARVSPTPIAGLIRQLTYGASPMSPDLLGEAMEVLSCDFQQGYGLTESSPTLTLLSPRDHMPLPSGEYGPQLASVGREASGVRVRVVDADDRDVAPGEVGEVIARGPNVMRGYWRRPEQTAAALRGGWLRTGDLARLDERGYLYLVDRIKDMLVSGGINVYPREIERQLEQHPAVAEVAVVGMPDERFGEVPLAFVVRATDAAGEEPDEAAFSSFLEPRLARFKRPRRYLFLAEMPRNAAGKVVKRELRRRLDAEVLR